MRAFSRVWAASAAVAAGLASAACLQKEVTQSIYISPSGVTWTVTERYVRSDETSIGARQAEEQEYVLGVHADRHPPAEALRGLGAQSVTTSWLRRERPYSVMTEATFPDLRSLAVALLRQLRIPGDATVVREGCQTTLSVRANVESIDEEGDNGLDALIADLDDYRIVLTQGRFAAAEGFTFEGDGVVAVPDVTKTPEDGWLKLRLVWDDAGCSSSARLDDDVKRRRVSGREAGLDR